jgi:hypothetical protein
MAGLGFAFTENILYFGGALDQQGWGGWAVVVLVRTIPFGLNHALFTGLIGAGLAAAYLSFRSPVKFAGPIAGLAAGMFFHSVHNLGASLAATNCLTLCVSFVFDWGGILMLGVLAALIWRQERVWMVEHLSGEVKDDIFQLTTSWQNWRRARWQALVQADMVTWRELGHLRQAATELAFKKHQLARRGQDPATQRDIDRHRERLGALGATSHRQVAGSFTEQTNHSGARGDREETA